MYMKNNGSSERHQNNNLIVMIEFSKYFDSNTAFYDINKKEQILSFLDTKIKDSSNDPEKRWIIHDEKIHLPIAYEKIFVDDKELDSYSKEDIFSQIKDKIINF
jgi:hypothetical protein